MKETCNLFDRGIHMITGEIKNKVDKIWENVWAAGLTNPLSVIEQITYLMFIRALDDQEINNIRSKTLLGADVELIFPESDIGQAMRWSNFKFRNADEIYNIVSNFVFPAIKAMKHGKLPDFDEHGKLIPIPDTDETKDGFDFFAKHMSTATFIVPTAQVLEKIITGLDDLYTHDIADLDMQGDLYEYMLSKLSTAGTNGQFRTPKHIREMMVRLLKPTPKDIICDPACGTAGFLVSAAEYVRANHSEKMDKNDWRHYESNMFSGFDTDTTMLRISAMNLMLHSIKYPQVDYKDSLSKQNTIHDAYTICLANPPFKGSLDKETINVTIAPIKYCPGAPILNRPVLNAIHADKPVRINGVALNNMLPNWNSELPPPENGPPRTMRIPRTASANPIRGLNTDSNTRTTNPTKIPPKIHSKEALSDFNPAEDFLFLFFIAMILLTITFRTSHV